MATLSAQEQIEADIAARRARISGVRTPTSSTSYAGTPVGGGYVLPGTNNTAPMDLNSSQGQMPATGEYLGMTYEEYMSRAPAKTTAADGTINQDYLYYQIAPQFEGVTDARGNTTWYITGFNDPSRADNTLSAGGAPSWGFGNLPPGVTAAGYTPGAARSSGAAGGGAGGGAGGSGGVPSAAAAEAASAQRDAYSRLNAVLADYGLGTLGQSVQSWLVEGLSEAEIVQRMRDTSEYKTRFPAIAARKAAGMSPISEGEYVAYEKSARQMMRAAGLPEGFYDGNDDFTKFLGNDLSLAELGDRVTLAANAAFKMPKEARDKLTEWGMGPGDITAFWLDPDKAQPLLERKYNASLLAGASTRAGYASINEQTANQLDQWGTTEDQAEQGFGALADSKELFQSLDRTEDVIGQDEQLAGVFGGDAMAARRREQRRRKRESTFSGGGGFTSTQAGLAGLGDSSDL